MPFNGGHCPEFIGYVFVPGMTPRADNKVVLSFSKSLPIYIVCVFVQHTNQLSHAVLLLIYSRPITFVYVNSCFLFQPVNLPCFNLLAL